MKTETLTENQTVVGGWSPYTALTPEDRKVFDEAMAGLVGVNYTPEQVSKQVVAGINYRFKCEASMPPSMAVWQAIVEIYQPLDKKPHVVGIIRL
ncbi:hypothetical protein [uncultured Tenacibaculum sp.]|uniref:hypothetical protein n=1 Tax=uncultured Tenacibaculum sp. TaxID=174713 RepID=UPI00261168ED|nr:hypothetical protein [uncultured Tenacibaculum sp.]